MTTPALRALKESRPGRKLTLLTSSAGAAVGPLIPELDEVLVYDAPWLKATAPRASSRPEYVMVERLVRYGFDAAVIFTVYSQNPLPSAFLCYLAEIPLRLAHCHENPYQLLTHWILDPEPQHLVRHEVQRQLNLVAAVGCQTSNVRLSVQPSPGALAMLGVWLAEHGQKDRQWVMVHPGVSAPARRYPLEGFAAASQQLVEDTGCQLVFTGSVEEQGLIEELRGRLTVPSYSLAGRLNLDELAALLAQVSLLISNNTGPAHLAAALGTPVVDLYALTNPQHTPWAVPHRVLFADVPCRYCYKSVCPEGHQNCLRLVPPEAVVQAARELLEGSQTGRTPSSETVRTLPPLTPPTVREVARGLGTV
jgi:lipopolysaccharide heptosyltransferase II